MTAFFRMHRKHKKVISSKSKSRNKIPGHDFLDFILLFYNAVENSEEKKLVELELSKEIFLNPEYPDFESKF